MTDAIDAPVPLRKQMLLLGAGPAHLHVLATLAQKMPPGVQITLVSPHSHYFVASMLPGFVAGQHTLEDCLIPLGPLVEKAGVRWLQKQVTNLDVNAHRVLLDDRRELIYDWLSINVEPVQDPVQMDGAMPGALENGLFVRPVEGFASLWPAVLELAQNRALRVAVIGEGAAALELAMAIRARLKHSAVTLITGETPVGAHYAPGIQRRVIAALKARNITVLPDIAVGIANEETHLGQGARLACDVPVIASGAQSPAWLIRSGLALDEQGFLAVDGCQISVNHPAVFASNGALGSETLSRNLIAVMSGLAPRARDPARRKLQLLSCGNHQAIAGWGNFSVQGYWVWLWKTLLGWSWVRRYQRA